MKQRRSKLRSVCKWSGAVLTVLLVVVWVGSGWCTVAKGTRSVYGGRLHISWTDEPEFLSMQGINDWRYRLHGFQFDWWFGGHSGTYDGGEHASFSSGMVSIPLWSLVLLAGVPTAWLWWRDRRRAPGLCVNCNYDLRNNTTGVCPECGEPCASVIA